MNETPEALIHAALRDLAEELNLPDLQNTNADTRLFGPKSPLDSMALVSLIADLEGRIAQQYGRHIVLADERAMSQARSPFRTVASLATHIEERLKQTPAA